MSSNNSSSIDFAVTQHMMYDLPDDDAFRPLFSHRLVELPDSEQLQDLQDLPPLPAVDHPDVVPVGDSVRVVGNPQLARPGRSFELFDWV